MLTGVLAAVHPNQSAALRTVPHCKIAFDQQGTRYTNKPVSLLSPNRNRRDESDISLIDADRNVASTRHHDGNTLEQLRRGTPWCWEVPAFLKVHWPRPREELLSGRYQPPSVRRVCEKCLHRRAVAIVPFIIR